MSKEELLEIKEELEKHLRKYPEIYIIKCQKYYKIGKSYDAYQRMKNIELSSPFKLEMVYHAEVNDAHKLEKKIHRKFRNKRVKGEWFELNKDEVKAVIKWIKKEAHY